MRNFKLVLVAIGILAMPVIAMSQVVSGRVTDAETQKGLAYVHVLVKNVASNETFSALTDQEGNFKLTGLSAGKYYLSARCLGYYTSGQEINVTANGSEPVAIAMKQAMIPLGEVEVSSLRYNKLEKDVSLPVVVVPREYFPRQSAVTLSDVLSNEPGIALVRDGGWGTSVNIRGLGESRLVTLVDGNRIETANDLVAGLSMFDVNEIERIEVIKGASSSIFGTGAMGGIVNILTQKGQYYNKPTMHGSATGIYEGVNNLLGANVSVESGSKTWKVRLSGGYRNAGDYKTPDGVMDNSQFNDRNINATIGIKPLKNHELEINTQHYQAFDAGIPGGAPFGKTATATYKEEKRQLIAGKYTIRDLLPAMSEVSLRVYHQYILRDVEMIPNTEPTVTGNVRLTAQKVTPVGHHNTSGAVLETKWKTGDLGKLVVGIDIWQRKLETSREKYIKQEVLDAFQMPVKTMEVIRSEKPIPDSRFGSGGLFAQHEFSLLDDKLELTYGARADLIRVSNEEGLDPLGITVDGVAKDPVPNQRITFLADTALAVSWSANISGMYHMKNNIDLTANMGRSFRSPSLEERFKYIDLGSKVRLGDPDLKPEKGWFADLGLRIWKDRFQLQVNGYANYIHDMIVEIPGTFEYTLNTGDNAGVSMTLPALINANVDQALLAGFDASINYQPFRNFVLYGKAAYVRGLNLKQDTDLPLIPPFSTAGGVRFQVPGIFNLQWTTTWVAAQHKIAEGELESDSYFLSDVAIYSAPKELGITSFQLFAGVDNLFNESYRNHLATNRGLIVSEPGRNLFVKLVMRF
ncbi:MAG: TonB-dependent receptor [Bacteroidota bacterium]